MDDVADKTEICKSYSLYTKAMIKCESNIQINIMQ